MAEVSGSLEMNSRRAYHHEFCDSFLTISFESNNRKQFFETELKLYYAYIT